jgi:hypothetical protein
MSPTPAEPEETTYRISDDPEGWVTRWLRRLASEIEEGGWTLERHSQCWTNPRTGEYEFTVTLQVQDVDE